MARVGWVVLGLLGLVFAATGVFKLLAENAGRFNVLHGLTRIVFGIAVAINAVRKVIRSGTAPEDVSEPQPDST